MKKWTSIITVFIIVYMGQTTALERSYQQGLADCNCDDIIEWCNEQFSELTGDDS